MRNLFWRAGMIVFLSFALLLSGCSFSIDLGGTSQPGFGTTTPQAVGQKEPGSAGSGNYSLSTTQFVLPSKAFAVYPPEGWENLAPDSKIQVRYLSPDGSVFISTQFTNTGYELDDTSFENYINGNQDNLYYMEDNYSETGRDLHLKDGYGTVYITYDYNNIPQTVERLYQREGNVIFETEFQADADQWAMNADFFNLYLDGVRYNAGNVSDYETYMFVHKHLGPNDLFSFKYLTPWGYTATDTNDKNYTFEYYAAPDGNAYIDVRYYNDHQTQFSQADAGQWAIDKLESYYAKGTKDLKIDSDQINENGYEQLNWHTLQENWVGITVFKAQGTEIMQLSVEWQKSFADVYQSSLEYVISTFTTPAE
jgi:hypothetical protein